MAHPQVEQRLRWQSKAILLLVVPWTAVNVLLQGHWWATQAPVVAIETIGMGREPRVFACFDRRLVEEARASGFFDGFVTDPAYL